MFDFLKDLDKHVSKLRRDFDHVVAIEPTGWTLNIQISFVYNQVSYLLAKLFINFPTWVIC
jgi:hypothetical protein